MPINFPDSPTIGQQFTVGDQTWEWTGTVWETVTITSYSPSAHAATHELGGSDPLELDPTQVTGLDELNTGTEGYTAVSNGTSGLSYQPVSHNYIINGAFDIWQRGDGPFTTNGYTADRWDTGSITSAVRSTDTPNENFEYSLFYEGGASNFIQIIHKIEAENVLPLIGKNFRLSFWMKPNADAASQSAGSATMVTADAKNDFSSTNFQEQRIQTLTANQWNFVSLLFSPLTTAASNGMALRFFLTESGGTGTPNAYITGVQLEAGSIATPFKRNANSLQGELAACQRYYQRIPTQSAGGGLANKYGEAGDANMIGASGVFPVQMRVAPTISAVTSLATSNCTLASIGGDEHGFLIRVDVTSSGRYRIFGDIEMTGAEL